MQCGICHEKNLRTFNDHCVLFGVYLEKIKIQ